MDKSKITAKWYTTIPAEGILLSTSSSKQPTVTYDEVAVELTGDKKLNRGYVSLETKIGVMDSSINTNDANINTLNSSVGALDTSVNDIQEHLTWNVY